MSRKPRVHTRCVASHYATPGERIIEIGDGTDGTGALIRLYRCTRTKRLIVDVYRAENVRVRISGRDYRPPA